MVHQHLRVVVAILSHLVLCLHERLEAHCERRHDRKQNDHQVLHVGEGVYFMEDLQASTIMVGQVNKRMYWLMPIK